MARYTGPRARVSRRLNTNIWGTAGETKALDKRPYPPGEHGRSERAYVGGLAHVCAQELRRAAGVADGLGRRGGPAPGCARQGGSPPRAWRPAE